MSARVKFWMAGIILAVLGVVTARIISQAFVGLVQLGIFLIGTLVALAGLGLIMAGINSHRRSPPQSDQDHPRPK